MPALLERCLTALKGLFTRHALINIAIGLCIELVLHGLNEMPNAPLVTAAKNLAFDRLIRARAQAPGEGGAATGLTLVAIDDATWRSAAWGGGEPVRAPRAQVLQLVEQAFSRGAAQVVLDVLVDGTPGRAVDLEEDRAFADGLARLLDSPHLQAPRQLVLVRSLRAPYPLQATGPSRPRGAHVEGFLPELRESPPVDAVIARSGGRIVVAAPYFLYSADRVLRDWQMFQVVCQRRADGSGRVAVVPSVQLRVSARQLGVDAAALDLTAAERCTPFPLAPPVDAASWAAVEAAAARPEALAALVGVTSESYWRGLRAAYAKRGVELGEHAVHEGNVGNRVVFRFADAPAVVPAHELLGPAPRPQRLPMQGHVVVVGQTYAEVPDHHATPLGHMPGPVVLLNAIDSMQRFGVVQPPPHAVTWAIAVVLIVLFGVVYAHWDSFLGTWIATGVVLLAMVPLSFHLFKYGIWLDFALPLLGIQLHRTVKSLEERWHRYFGRRAAPKPEELHA
jgi:hypothetical protein